MIKKQLVAIEYILAFFSTVVLPSALFCQVNIKEKISIDPKPSIRMAPSSIADSPLLEGVSAVKGHHNSPG
jgi:hypothetical protein